MNKNKIIKGFLEIIQSISDLTYQNRIWIKGEGPECDSFDETIEFFFHFGNIIKDEIDTFDLSKSQVKLFNAIYQIFDRFTDYHEDPREFIDSKEWKKIVKLSQKVLKAFPNSQNL